MAIKDSGERVQMAGMVRDTTKGKIRYDLVVGDGPMFKRWAQHLTDGAVKYAARNWMGAKSQEELERFRESALRHFIQWYTGELDEDHAAAVFFNINGAEYVKNRIPTTLPTNRTGSADRRKCYNKELRHARRNGTEGRRKGDANEYWKHPVCKEEEL